MKSLQLITSTDGVVSEIDVSNFKKIKFGCYNSRRNIITISGQEDEFKNGQYPKKPIVVNYDLNTGGKEVILRKLVYDCLWDELNDKLIYSSGNIIFSYGLISKLDEKLFRFTNIKYAPINPSISPNNRFFSYLKYKSNSRRLQVLNLETNENQDCKINCGTYQWYNEETIIFSTPSGKIKFLDLESLKVKSSKIDLDTILKQEDKKLNELKEQISTLPGKIKDFVVFEKPKIYGDRIFFIMGSGVVRSYSLHSINLELEDYKLEFYNSDKITDYWILNNNLYLYMARRENNESIRYILKKEKESTKIIEELNFVLTSKLSDHKLWKIKCD